MRNTGNRNNDDCILIIDTAADQCTCGGEAWTVLDQTGDQVRCDGFIKGKDHMIGPILPIVTAATCVVQNDGNNFILIMNQACYYSDEEQKESLCLPYQAEQHGVKFDLTPRHRLNANNENGKQKMIIEDKEIPLEFDGLKMFLRIRAPTSDEMGRLPTYELTSPSTFIPDTGDDHENILTQRRKNIKKKKHDLPGNLTMEEWQKRLAYAPEDVIRKTFMATTQLAMNVETENRLSGRRHYKPRFAFLKEKRINDVFHSDTFYPTTDSSNGDTCSQLFIGKSTDYMKVYPMKTESHSFRALQDFARTVGIPRGIKTDNASTETGLNWTKFCRENRIDTTYSEPYSPWQNYSEHGIGDLGRMVSRCMAKFDAPLTRHHWCQQWCCDVRNHLASRKLNWRTPEEKVSGETPDISMFRFHFWQEVEYYNPKLKQPSNGWLPARFLGIAWDSGDSMTYYVEPTHKKGRPSVLVRSNVRPKSPIHIFPHDPSGERDEIDDTGDQSEGHDTNISDDPTHNNHEDPHEDTSHSPDGVNETPTPSQSNITTDDNLIEQDDAEQNQYMEHEHDDAVIHEQIMSEINDEVEDFEFDHIQSYKWHEGMLVFDVMLTSGKNYGIPFNVIKKG